MTRASRSRHQRMDDARARAELTVPDLWLRYLALGGTGDEFDLDGYLNGVTPLDFLQQDVLAHALNEALGDCYRAHLVPLSPPMPVAGDINGLDRVVDRLLGRPPADESATD
jgi:hypothetical protein